MMLKPQSLAPLETIYEESGSFTTSTVDSQPEDIYETINGLISARSIPSVDIERQRANGNYPKPPIEVRFRDGSKRYIHPSTTATMMINRRNLLDSSDENLSSNKISNSNYQQIFHSNFNKKKLPSKSPLVVTIITADDLNQAGLTPTMSSSPDGSDIAILTQSQRNSPMNKIKSIEDIHEVAVKRLPTTPVQSSAQSVVHNYLSPASRIPYSPQKQQQVVINHRQNLNPSQSFSTPSIKSFTVSTQSSTDSSPKTFTSSLQVSLTNNKNQRNLSLNSNLTNGTVRHPVQPNTTISVGGRDRSAFRPFLKPTTFTQQSQVPLTINRRPYNSTQQQQIVPYFQLPHKQYPPTSSSNMTHVSYRPSSTQNSIVVPRYSHDAMVPTQIILDAVASLSSSINSSKQMNPLNYQQQSLPISQLTNNNMDKTLTFSRSANPGQTLSFAANPTMTYFNVTSNSIYDIPHLSSKYSRIPLRITLPDVSPAYNQRLVIKHNTALEKRLLNAGLSPETIALYERILDVAENRQMNILPLPKILDQYSYKSLI